MEFFMNVCVVATTIFTTAYLCYVMLRPERF